MKPQSRSLEILATALLLTFCISGKGAPPIRTPDAGGAGAIRERAGDRPE